eukprot:595345-Pelagomonas_calceolata.AAC.5
MGSKDWCLAGFFLSTLWHGLLDKDPGPWSQAACGQLFRPSGVHALQPTSWPQLAGLTSYIFISHLQKMNY